MSKPTFRVVLVYPVAEQHPGLGTIRGTRCESDYFENYGDAWAHYKAQERRLSGLGEGAQADLLCGNLTQQTSHNIKGATNG